MSRATNSITLIFLALIWISFMGGSHIGAQETSPQLESSTHQGKVIATMDSGGYTYIEFEEKGKRIWAAAPKFEVAVGDSITFSSALPMTDFHSRTLERTFDSIFFVNQIKVEGKDSPSPKKMRIPEGHIPVNVKPKKEVLVEPGSILKAEGGYSVAECFVMPKPTRDGEIVKVRGRVVKFTGEIMGRNWIHIQDGTGEEGSRDLTVTTQSEVGIGDLILVSGKISYDKDFGAGYVYPVIIEEAAVTVEEKGDQR